MGKKNKFEFEHSKDKVKVTVAILDKKHFHRSSAFIYRPRLILLHINVLYDYILDKFMFECSRDKVKVTVAIF